MNLDYYTLLCPEPISLSIGSIKHPTLRAIGKLSYPKFGMFQVYLKMTPNGYYTEINKEQGEKFWNHLSYEQQKDFSMYDVILIDDEVRYTYEEILNFFFVERVIFRDNLFYVIDTDDYETTYDDGLPDEHVVGIIYPQTFVEVIDILQQICCIKSDDLFSEPKPKFKNKKAKMLYEKMLKANDKQKKKTEKKEHSNLVLANIISATAAKAHGLNIVNIWETTLFQLYDQFNKIRNDDTHYINSVRVAVWGDEKNQFDQSLWYKNNFEQQ